MTEVITIAIDRGNNSMATSFLVWAKFRSFPECDGDGVFVGDIAITADASSVNYDWTSPNNSTLWKFIAIPRYLDQVGIPGQLASV